MPQAAERVRRPPIFSAAPLRLLADLPAAADRVLEAAVRLPPAAAARRVLRLCAAVLAVVSAAAGCTWHLDPDLPKHAVVFGVSQYVDGENNVNLQYSDNDAEAIAELFASRGYTVHNHLSGQNGGYTNGAATLENLEHAFAEAAKEVGKDDLFVFYFSGHGLRIDQLNEEYFEDVTLEGGDTDEYILPHGAITAGSSGVRIDLDAAVNPRRLDRLLRGIPAWRRVAIIDTCHAGGFAGGGGTVDLVPDDYQGGFYGWMGNMSGAVGVYLQSPSGSGIRPSTAVVLAATGAAEYAWEPTPDSVESGVPPHGLFTAALLEGARRGDRNGDGRITVTELYDYVVKTMPRNVRVAGSGETDWFYPRVSGGAVDFVLF